MNPFVELCKLASDENWCWNLYCTTCGHMHFRYAFAELATGKSPTDPSWIINRRNTRDSNSLGLLPRSYTEEQKEKVATICRTADLPSIAEVCKFPDWLGYLGLVLEHMYSSTQSYRKLSESWASQLSKLVVETSAIRMELDEIATGHGVLTIKDLEACERSIMNNKGPLRS